MSYYYAAPFGNDGNTGDSFARAKRSIQAAIDLAAPGETVRIFQGAYSEALTISKPIEVVVYSPSKAWGTALLVGPGTGAALTISGLTGSQKVRFIGVRFQNWGMGIGGSNTGGNLEAMGCFFDPSVAFGINPGGMERVKAWSCVFEEQQYAFGGVVAPSVTPSPIQADIVEARGCTFFDCKKSIAVGNAGLLARWRNCIFHNAGASVKHVELDSIVAFEADYNLYGGAMPTSGYFSAGGVDYSSDALYDSQWLAFQDLHSPARNGNPSFLRTS